MLKLDHKEDWAPKNWCFWIVCWRRLLRVPWAARRSNQSFVKEINPEYSLEGLMMKLKFQYFGHPMQRADSLEIPWCWERLRAGREGGDGWMASLTQWTWVWANSGSWWWTGKPGVLQSMGSQRVGHDLVTEQQILGLNQPLEDIWSPKENGGAVGNAGKAKVSRAFSTCQQFSSQVSQWSYLRTSLRSTWL